MMSTNLIIVIKLILGIFVSLGLFTYAASAAPGAEIFIDTPSFVIVFPPAILLALSSVPNYSMSCLVKLNSNTFQLQQAKVRFFRMMGTYSIRCGIIGTVIGFIQMAQSYDHDQRNFGYCLAIDLITIFYGYTFSWFICNPIADWLEGSTDANSN